MSTQYKTPRTHLVALKKITTYLIVLVLILFVPSIALAEETFAEGDIEDLYDNLNSILEIVIAIGGFWTVGCIIFSGMRLSGSQGNPTARVQGIIGLVFAILGGFVVYKCLTIAGWITGI
ncbi:hypothetical protein AB3N04_01125 (plasmid) [Alkalihalophilus sp. As8PL]|uniref:TrbC/VIRB2 family protein n=1 Tax=Alkalihalophilus sp. As8PL TaxID=3237103 RepID=A0AB39BMT3_9BACI